MSMKKRVYDDDDGRTVADMSNVSRQRLLIPRLTLHSSSPAYSQQLQDDDTQQPNIQLTREERRWYILGAVKAALLIALAFIVGLAIVVLLFLL